MRVVLLLLVFGSLLVASGARAAEREPKALSVPGFPDAFYVPPSDPHARRVMVYLHARGGEPQRDCRAWARLVRPFAWTLCPQGAGTTPSGGRTWNNDAAVAERTADAAVAALKAAHPGRVGARGNVLAGFSEGAFVLQQIGVHEPERWSRWLVLAASDRYWGPSGGAWLASEREHLRRVALLTGERDGVVDATRRVGALLDEAGVPVHMRIVPGLGHELALGRLGGSYRKLVVWSLDIRHRRGAPSSTRAT